MDFAIEARWIILRDTDAQGRSNYGRRNWIRSRNKNQNNRHSMNIMQMFIILMI